jgi:hypothetical protein
MPLTAYRNPVFLPICLAESMERADLKTHPHLVRSKELFELTTHGRQPVMIVVTDLPISTSHPDFDANNLMIS